MTSGSNSHGRRWMGAVAALAVVWSLATITPARPAPSSYRNFAIPSGSDARSIVQGPDGNLWFTLPEVNKIGRITPAGVVTEFSLPVAGSHPCGIAAGPDGNLWFTQTAREGVLGRITPGGVITEFSGPNPYQSVQSGSCDLVAGPDGMLWIGEAGRGGLGTLQRTSLSGSVDMIPSTSPTFGFGPNRITVGGDGAVWTTAHREPLLGRATTAGATSRVTLPGVGTTTSPAGPTATSGRSARGWTRALPSCGSRPAAGSPSSRCPVGAAADATRGPSPSPAGLKANSGTSTGTVTRWAR